MHNDVGTLIGVPPLQPHDAYNSTVEGHIRHQRRDSAAEIGCYEVLGRHNFHTVASSQSYYAIALITKIMNILHVNVAQEPASVGSFKTEMLLLTGTISSYHAAISVIGYKCDRGSPCYGWISFSILVLDGRITRCLTFYCEDSISVCYILDSWDARFPYGESKSLHKWKSLQWGKGEVAGFSCGLGHWLHCS